MGTTFSALGVTVKGGLVTKGLKNQPLAGAEAVITEGGRVHRYGAAAATGAMSFGVGALTALSKKSKASAIVTFATGESWEHKLSGNREVRKAQAEAVKFSALARAAESRHEHSVPEYTPRDTEEAQQLRQAPSKSHTRPGQQPQVPGRPALRQPTLGQALKVMRANKRAAKDEAPPANDQ